MSRWLHEPLLAFFLIGAGLFAAYSYLAPGEETPVEIGAGGLAVLFAEYEALTGSEPDAEQREKIINDYYRREVLFREGLRDGLPENNAELRDAIIQVMQQSVTGQLPEPTGRELVEFYADHMDRYYLEPTITLEQRFREVAPANPEAVLAGLRQSEALEFDLPPGGALLQDYGESLLRGMFGPEAFARLQVMPLQRWEGPFETRDGWHYFLVRQRRPRELLSFERAKDQVLADYQSQALADRLETYIRERRDRYPLFVPAGA